MRTHVRPGEIQARGLGRVFEIRLVQARSLKATLLGREPSRKRELWALRDVDFDIAPGEAFGVVGQNGSGKSTLLKLMAGIFAPSTGTLAVGGRVGSLIEVGAGFHPEFTGRENVYLNSAIYGIPRKYVDAHLDEIIGFAELESFADMPVKTYSSGMFMRLGFSVAMHINPDILLLDEVLAVGDEPFQQKCYGKIWDFKRDGGSIVFVSHNAAAVEKICDRAMLLEAGRAVEHGTAEDVLRGYHRRLAEASDVSVDGRTPRSGSAPCRIHEVRAVAGDGEVRDRFTEGEPVALEVWLYSDTGVEDVQVSVVVREASNYLIGAQTAPGVNLRPERLERLRLHFPGLPMREGRFYIDVSVSSSHDEAPLAVAERALELTVFSADPTGGGAVRLGGAWEYPEQAQS